MTTYEIINICMLIISAVSVVVSPLIAIIITRNSDEKKEIIRRKSEIFARLMGTRAHRLSIEHVSALNLVQLEFHDAPNVINNYKIYMSHLNKNGPEGGEVAIKFFEERSDHLMDLMHSMAAHLGYSFDKRDLQKLSYGPQGWYQEGEEIRMLRSLLVDVLSNSKPLNVIMRHAQPPSDQFPPPPTSGDSP